MSAEVRLFLLKQGLLSGLIFARLTRLQGRSSLSLTHALRFRLPPDDAHLPLRQKSSRIEGRNQMPGHTSRPKTANRLKRICGQ
jgi:hypothetical protein